MKFEVPLDVLAVKGYTTSDVGLYHQEDGKWVLKPTVLLSTDNKTADYQGTFDSCSPFMINFEKDATTTTSSETKPAEETKTDEKTTTKDDSSSTTEKTSETQKRTTETKTTPTTTKSPFPIFGILVGVGAAGILMRRRR